MRKEQRDALVEFFTNVPDEELKFAGVRLLERLAGDIPAVLEYFEKRPEVHAVLTSAGSAEEVFSILTIIQDMVSKEAKKRGIILTMRPLQPVD